MTVNEKLKQFAVFKGLTPYKFCKITGLAQGSLRGSRSVTVESLAKIVDIYPELNLQWLMFNKGAMIKSGDVLCEPTEDYKLKLSIDAVVDAKIEEKLESLRQVMAAYIRADIVKEIEDAESKLKKKRSK